MQSLVPVVDLPLTLVLWTPLIFLFFIGIIVWVFRRGSGEKYSRAGNLALENGSSKNSQIKDKQNG